MERMALNEEEVELIHQHRLDAMYNAGFIVGLQIAADKAESYGDECQGGGETASAFYNLANAIRKIEIPKRGTNK
jgi:hypothetical protein